MILHPDPSAPALIKAAAAAVLVLHISGAATALVVGPVALFAKKGGRVHRIAGTTFLVSMLTMSLIGMIVAPMLNDPISSLGGAVTFYLTATGWLAAVRRDGRSGPIELVGLFFAMGIFSAAMILGMLAAATPTGRLNGLPYQIPFGFVPLIGLMMVCDLRVMIRKVSTPSQRIARHLWRIGTALAFAQLSFSAQPKAQPDFLRGSLLLALPALVYLGVVIFYLIKTRFPRNARTPARAAPAAGAAFALR